MIERNTPSTPQFKPPPPERIEIAGPAGRLEALLEIPENARSERFGVICHPHPQHGGTLTNKVVHTLARAFNELGVPTLRFNFRGVGASAGTFDHGRGETEDARAVLTYAQERWPGARAWLAGFSFGGVIAARAAQVEAPALLVTVAPAVTRLQVADLAVPQCPWLIIQGDADEIVAPQAVLDWAKRLNPAPTVQLLPGAGHFFHGRLTELREAVLGFARTSQGSQRGTTPG